MERDLVQEMLSKEEILGVARGLGVTVQELLRANSPVYKERKEELLAMGEEELAAVIATEPTLIKRPIVKSGGGFVVGLDEEKVAELLGMKA